MIPRLYEANINVFGESLGLAALTDCLTCEITEERHGDYSLELTLPVGSDGYEYLTPHRIIYAKANDESCQPFEIYQVTKSMDGIATVYANHVSYRLYGMPFLRTTNTFSGAAALFAAIPDNVPFNGFSGEQVRIPVGFSFRSESQSTATIKVEKDIDIHHLLVGSEGSVIDQCGGELEYDHFTVIHRPARGADNGVVIRYGKNMLSLEHESDSLDKYNGAAVVWESGDDYVRGNTVYFKDDHIKYPFIEIVDVSSEFETRPTTSQLNAKSLELLPKMKDLDDISIPVSFVPLWNSAEYGHLSDIERVKLCDTVRVINEEMGIDVKTKVVKTVYDSLMERYIGIEIGTLKTTLSDTIAAAGSGTSSGSGGGGSSPSQELAAVAYSGSYNDLGDKPSIPSIEGLAKDSDLAAVAKSGSYSDLTGQPTWKTCGNVTGTGQIQIPASANDIHVIVHSGRDNADSYVFNLIRADLTEAGSSEKSMIEGHYRSTSTWARYIIKYTSNYVRLDSAYDNGTNYASSSKVIVYYR